MEERHIIVPRAARYYTLGDARTAKRVWFVLHGYGQLARYFLRSFEGLEKDLLIVAPEGLSRFYTDAGHSRVGATWMTREDREREIDDHVQYLDLLADRMLQECPQAQHGQVLGFSQGVATAARWSMHGRTALQRLVLWGGGLPAEMNVDRLQTAWKDKHVDLVAGQTDAIVTEEQGRQQDALLNAAGVPHAYHVHPGGHALDPLTLTRLLAIG
ncbi:MAG: phospholipase [Flavobacteriales bacterium]|nr:phospholipase [Flavobacteriales bacterium]MBK9286348.1 phospholipase [Flavobacteriales bacterium]MBL0034718.1 phospholipase [Flavobacteriales bacterium]